MTATYLDDIVRYHRERAAHDERVWQDRLADVHYDGPSMIDALGDVTTPNVKVIAEVKRRSPSRGWIDEHLDVAQLARHYQAGGASAISVLTDGPHFAGSSADLVTVHAETVVPILRKDFTVSANDVLDAAALGASAVLLIVAALSDEELALFSSVARQCGLDALVEVHDDDEADRAMQLGATLIGVNQRDLRTFEVRADRATSLIGRLPRDVVTVAESGLSSREDVERAAEAGFNAVLVGESFIRSTQREAAVRDFSGVARVARA
jgi:indole-3-glycerol phosphate synthase